jgi:hypothetical protein
MPIRRKAKRIKRKIIFFFLLNIIFIPLYSFLFWLFSPKKELHNLIIDKTVPIHTYEEHRSLIWVLNNKRFVINNHTYKVNTDYFGIHPAKTFRTSEIDEFSKYTKTQTDSILHYYDMAYVADTYGVYINDYNRLNDKSEFSRVLYGGFSLKNFEILKAMKDRGKLIIMEFNSIAPPTLRKVRKMAENEFGLQWSGWTGRYFQSLDTLKTDEIPRWMLKKYRHVYKKDWNYNNAGVVLVSNWGDIFVLEDGKELTFQDPMIVSYKENKYHLPVNIHYPFWFDITYPTNNNKVLSYYHLKTTEIGDSLLYSRKLSNIFPAVIYSENKKFYYFCGDFSDNTPSLLASYFKGFAPVRRFFNFTANPGERLSFFYKYYDVIVSKILNDYYDEIKNK